jgi:hypothetical protein
VEELIRSKVNKGSSDWMTLDNFQKVDGQARNVDGVPYYVLEFTASVFFKKAADHWEFRGNAPDGILAIWPVAERGMAPTTITCEIGDRIPLHGTAVFSKSEAGWKVREYGFSATGGRCNGFEAWGTGVQ